MADEKNAVRQLTVKVPLTWHIELVKIIGTEMAETGEEVTMTGLVARALDKLYSLEKKTGISSDGESKKKA